MSKLNFLAPTGGGYAYLNVSDEYVKVSLTSPDVQLMATEARALAMMLMELADEAAENQSRIEFEILRNLDAPDD